MSHGKIKRTEIGELEETTRGISDSIFPQYLVNKGATYIGNIVENPDLLQNLGEIWKLPNESCIGIKTEKKLQELVDRFGYENIQFPYFHQNLPLQEEIHQTLSRGYSKCFIERDKLDCIQMIHFLHEFEHYLPTLEFSDFKRCDLFVSTK